jgi:N-acyl homoserine lactone hydrolase
MKGSLIAMTDSPQRLYLMQVALAPSPFNVPIVCYLIQTGEGRNILIDSGFPANIHSLQLPPGYPTPIIMSNVIEQLALLGLRPEDIDLLICSHFDLDHSGYHGAFPAAKLVVQRKHYEFASKEVASESYPRFLQTRPQWDQPTSRYWFVEGDTTLLPGLEVIETSGHTPGHQSILVRLPKTGPVLLPIDAAPRQRSFLPDRKAGPSDDNEEVLRANICKLLDLVQREQVALVIFGHDYEQWQTLKKVPDYYD